jgi:hypothetical protein
MSDTLQPSSDINATLAAIAFRVATDGRPSPTTKEESLELAALIHEVWTFVFHGKPAKPAK